MEYGLSDRTSQIEQFLEEATASEPDPPKKRRVLRNTLIVVGVLLALVGIALASVYALVAKEFNEVERVSIEQDPTLERPDPVVVEEGEQAPINILLLGSDSRDTTDPDAGIDDLSGFRSDAILVAQISPERDHGTLMSIMVDD